MSNILHFTSHISPLTTYHSPKLREGQKRARSKADGLTRQGHAQYYTNQTI
ncbi:MAG TPA: hypothetical protein PKN57_09775 [Saprospiraceae bacterium]|nr:hypothetical protein [Saprospiraceae bacterium]MCC6689094.1 hypothetical protein [Saprospiraceae bacterium]HMX83342.1 hypothetical protein [Saprospiraceae bacterium]HMX85714.1 hypothetical protein [Saprospiraceae bacterium]HMZ73741.1 hypothetical protein [Saprospiraceae bacterium]